MPNEKPASESQRITKEIIELVEYDVEEGNPVFWGHAQELLFEINRLNSRNASLVHENDELNAENEMLKEEKFDLEASVILNVRENKRLKAELEELNHE